MRINGKAQAMPRGAVSDIDRAWAAGYVDGEGCIHLSRDWRKNLIMRVSVTSCRMESLEFLRSRWGGFLHLRKLSLNLDKNQRDTYQWRLQSAAAARFIEDIKPYLVIKKEPATLALAFQQLIPGRAIRMTWCRKHGDTDPQCLLDVRETIRARLGVVNQRGRKPAQKAVA